MNDISTPIEGTVGYCKGEVCNRNGCLGVIDEHEKEGSCSCHIHPPCSYCTTDTSYCPKCNWEPADDINPVDPEIQRKNQEYYRKENERFQAARELFYEKYNGTEPITELEMRTESHTHFSQKVIGIFPPNTETQATLLPKIIGTFGGRWEGFNPTRGSFSFIAYTD